MKEITATQLKSNLGEFFDALLSDGGVVITRHGKRYPVGLLDDATLAQTESERAKERAKKLERFLAAQAATQESLQGVDAEDLGIDPKEMALLEGE